MNFLDWVAHCFDHTLDKFDRKSEWRTLPTERLMGLRHRRIAEMGTILRHQNQKQIKELGDFIDAITDELAQRTE